MMSARIAHRVFMRAIIGCLLCCLSVFGADTNEIRVVTRTDAKVSRSSACYFITHEEFFTWSGQTNLLRTTLVKDGVTNCITHSYIPQGAWRYSQGGGFTFVNSAASAPDMRAVLWDSSNQINTASVTTTNYVNWDSWGYKNGIFFPLPAQ
jgi:hypothetical protein